MDYDENGNLTPHGLASWMDEEGGLDGLMLRNGPETFIEAGVNPVVAYDYVRAMEAMDEELYRIGAIK